MAQVVFPYMLCGPCMPEPLLLLAVSMAPMPVVLVQYKVAGVADTASSTQRLMESRPSCGKYVML